MSTNPYEPPKEESRQAQLAMPKRHRWNPWWLLVTFGWTAFIILTNTYADNLRYFGSWPTYLAYAGLIGCGNLGSLFCLYRGARGWWHLLFLPIWFLSGVELLILIAYTARLINGPH